MKQTYTAPNGTEFVAQVNGNTLTLYVPRGPEVHMKVPPAHKSRLGYAIKRTCFDTFADVVDQIDGAH